MVHEVKQITGGRPVEIRCHKDFWLRVASSPAAGTAGAEAVHVPANGPGQRTGNPPLEETAASLIVLPNLPISVRRHALVRLSRRVEQLSGVALPKTNPIAVEITFSRETGPVSA